MKRGKRRSKAIGNKKFIWLALAVLVVGVGFAALQKYIRINGNASIDSTFDVGIQSITLNEKTEGAFEKSQATYTSTTANFNVGLTTQGDSIKYEIKVYNYGSTNAKVKSIDLTQSGTQNISFEYSGIEENEIIGTGRTKTFYVTAQYIGNSDELYEKELSVVLLFEQTSDLTSSQEELISNYQQSVPEFYYYITSASPSSIKARFIGGWGDGPEEEDSPALVSADLYKKYYDGPTKVFTDSFDVTEGYEIFYNQCEIYQIKDNSSIGGQLVSTDFSLEKGLSFELYNNYVLERQTHVSNGCGYSNEGKKAVKLLDSYLPTTLTINLDDSNIASYENSFASNQKSIRKIIITGSNTDKLKAGSLSIYNSTYNIAYNEIVNLTGESLNWQSLMGLYRAGESCNFETGTCNGVTITNESN